MNLLAAVHYDPAVAASKATSALLAMTALDTAALRVTFTVPLSGRVYVRVSGGALHGAATYPSILVGILSGATVIARHQPIITINGAASATTPAQVFCEFVVPGLTPGSAQTWDLAYGVEQLVAATGWKYGGPNNATTAGDAFGGISFTVFDPSPIYLPTVMPTASVQANQSTSLANEAVIASYIDTEVGTIIANQGTLATTVAGVKAKTDTLPTSPAAVSDIPSAATIAAAVWAAGTRSLTTFGTLAADVWAAATRTITGGTITTYTGNTPQTGDAFARLGAPAGASVSADVAAVKAQTATINAKTANLPADPADASDLLAAISAVPDLVWDEPMTGHGTAGTTGAALSGAGAAGDPWGTPLPGAYATGTAGKLLGDRLAAPLATTAQVTAVRNAIGDSTTGTLTTDIAAIGPAKLPTRRR